MSRSLTVNRRGFLKIGAAIGSGLTVGCYLPALARSAEAATSSTSPFEPNAFIRISTDESITVIVHKSEMGQGIYTALPMLVAEELDADWETIRVEAAPVAPVYNHTVFGLQLTGGSTSVWSSWEQLRKAGAAARAMLIAAAAQTWQVNADSCRTDNGFVIHEASPRRLSYGQLAQHAAQMTPPKAVVLKDVKNFKFLGKPMKRLDTPEKVNGRAMFGIDVKVPGMLTAVVARAPVFGATVKSVNADKAKAVPGVKAVVPIDAGLAVVADGFWPAKQGCDRLEIVWDEGPLATLDTRTLRAQYAELAKQPGALARQEGEIAAALRDAARTIEVVYEVPYLAHATMEPLNCMAHVRPDGCDVWTGTQFQTIDRDAAAHIAGLKPEQVRVHTTLLGGGFGRRAVPDSHFVREAVQLSQAVKTPVKVIWTREDDIQGGWYRPMYFHALSAGLEAAGDLTAWSHRIVGQSILTGTPFESVMVKNGIDGTSVEGAADLPYAIPNLRIAYQRTTVGVPVLWWRSVGHSHTAFVTECFLDEVATATGKDPFEFRRELLDQHPRHQAVLELAAARAGWGTPLPEGHARGIAVHESYKSFVAQVAEVSISQEGQVNVHRVVCAIDCGPVVNPDIVQAQMESGIVYGLTAALHGEITLANGRVQQSNFHDYPLLGMHEMPVVEVHVVPRMMDQGGAGEPGVPPIAPAVANAIFAVRVDGSGACRSELRI